MEVVSVPESSLVADLATPVLEVRIPHQRAILEYPLTSQAGLTGYYILKLNLD